MRNFIYRCPETGLNVQGSVDDEDAELKQYVAQVCLACGRVHTLNPRTGKLMSEEFRPPDEG
jgi:hypothetical protein